MTPYYETKLGELLQTDCRSIPFPDNHFTGVITDPPYELGFMGKKWDSSGVAFQVETWVEILRICKPGAMLMAFGGTRTNHRLVCAIEDAGWEIRDSMMYIYGSGFPKGHNWPLKLHEKACVWHGRMVESDHEKIRSNTAGMEASAQVSTRAKSKAEHCMRFVHASYLSQAVYACAECGQVLQPFMSEQNLQEQRTTWSESKLVWPEQSGMEGRSDLEAPEGKLQRCEICTLSHGVFADGAEGPLRHGTQIDNGEVPWQIIGENGSRTSYRPQSLEQFHRKPSAILVERQAQKSRGYNVALKPAYEPIVVAMAPIDGTFANNALVHGVAGLNIDAGRVGTEIRTTKGMSKKQPEGAGTFRDDNWIPKDIETISKGRWPANIILSHHPDCECVGTKKIKGHKGYPNGPGGVWSKEYQETSQIAKDWNNLSSESDNEPWKGHADSDGTETVEDWNCHPDCPIAIMDSQSGERPGMSGGGAKDKLKKDSWAIQPFNRQLVKAEWIRNDTGGASRFFYTAKASRSERGKDNDHPTVKPTALIKYLVELTAPPKDALILDPFIGSGTLGVVCEKLGIKYVGIDLDCSIAAKRIERETSQQRLPGGF